MSKTKKRGVGQAIKGFGRALGLIEKPYRLEDKLTIHDIDPGFLSTSVTTTIKKPKKKD